MPSKILSDMRRVYRNPPSKDVTESQKKLRQWYNDDAKGFFTQLAQLERTFEQKKKRSQKWTNGSVSSEPAPEEEVDIGRARCEELIDMLLEEWEDWETEKAQYERLKEKFEGTESRPENSL